IANEPFTSVVVAYFFPVNVLVAVTLTPGNGTGPAFTVPAMVPPLGSPAGAAGAAGTTGADVWPAGSGASVAGALCTAAGACSFGAACPHALKPNPRLNTVP